MKHLVTKVIYNKQSQNRSAKLCYGNGLQQTSRMILSINGWPNER